MGVIEIVLIVFGIIAFVLSFMLPAGKENESAENAKINEEVVKEMLSKEMEKEMEKARSQIGDIVDEAITYAMEKTERGMERLTNEKIMAVNEYSDTVLEEINKNHKEVVFLYDMLNDKHESLKKTVSKAAKIAEDVKRTLKDAEVTTRKVQETATETVENTAKNQDEFVPFTPEKVEVVKETISEEINNSKEKVVKEQEANPPKKKTRKPRATTSRGSGKVSAVAVPKFELDLSETGKNIGKNNNERILKLHEAGKSNMAIAKELGLGIGEVKLVIYLKESEIY